MRRSVLATLVLLLVVSGFGAERRAHAEGGSFGLGLIIGSPTGISGKYYLAPGEAIDFAIGGALAGRRGIHIHADYLWHPWVLAREESFDLAVYLGVGGRVLSHQRRDYNDDFHLGVRGPIGLVFDFLKADVPLDVFVEVAMIFDIVVDTDDRDEHGPFGIDLNAGIGVRYYF